MRPTEASNAPKLVMLVAVCIGILLFYMWTPSADDSGEGVEPMLSPELVSELSENCDANEIYQRAWVQILSAEEYADLAGGELFDHEERLREEVTPILLACLEKELSAIDCDTVACADVDGKLESLRADVFSEYFFGNIISCYSSGASGYDTAWAKYQAKLAECYRSIFNACDCDMEGLLALWADLVLNEANPLDGAESMALAEAVLSKYEECLIEQIGQMTNVYEMMRLVFVEDARDQDGYRVVRGDTFYNNYTVACAILKRLIQLYELETDVDDKHLCSPCCDTVWLLGWLFDTIGGYNLEHYPERDWSAWTNWDQDNLVRFLRHMEAVGELYTLCRKHMLEQATADCYPNAFCRILACREHGIVGHKDALEDQLTDPREQAFLAAFKQRIEECVGREVELQDVIDWCTTVPAKKTWDNLKSAQPEPAIPEETRTCAEDLGEASGTDYKNSGFARYRVAPSKHLSFFREEIDAYLTCTKLGACARMVKAWLNQAPLEFQKELAEIFWNSFEEANR